MTLLFTLIKFVLFLVTTSIPNVTEVKENMTFGSTLVTNPKGGFLVRRGRVKIVNEQIVL